MKKAKNIKGILDIIDKYDVFILDQWGVMHDGITGFKAAIKCVEKLYQKKKKIIIISNSSKRKENSIKKLPFLGFNSKLFFEVMTSGEMIWQGLNNKKYKFLTQLKKNCYHIYDKKNPEGREFVRGLDKYNFVNKIEKSDFILGCTPEIKKITEDYIPLLIKAKKLDIPFVCANPDFETLNHNSKKLTICMGTVAELYGKLGGKIFFLGKPKIDIYVEATKKLKNLKKNKVLAIGDSIHHDILGANSFGVDSLLITSGIHHSSFNFYKPTWNSKRNKLINLGIIPTYLCSKFKL